MGAQCVVPGLSGAKLAHDDLLVPMQLCGASSTSSLFPDPQPIAASYNTSHDVIFDLGNLSADAAPETLQLCWCPLSSNCSAPEHFRAMAARLDVVCPPGTYELFDRVKQCHDCPPGHFCPGGKTAQRHQCKEGSTSPRRSSSEQDCQCRANGRFDVDPSLDLFNCTEQASLSAFTLGASHGIRYARTVVHAFSGSLEGAGSSSLEGLRSALSSYLGLERPPGQRASLKLGGDGSRLEYEVTSSEPELAAELSAKFDSAPFSVWIFSEQQDTDWAPASVSAQGAVQEQVLECPDGLAFPDGPVAGPADCKCPHGMEPVEASAGSCQECPLGKYKASVGDTSCTSCSFGLTTLASGAVSSAACTCSAGYFSTVPGDATSCEDCAAGFFCRGGQACPRNQSTLLERAAALADCVCAAGHFPTSGTCEACGPGRFKPEADNAECEACEVGKWSSAAGAISVATCTDCIPGSTTESDAAGREDLCIRSSLCAALLDGPAQCSSAATTCETGTSWP